MPKLEIPDLPEKTYKEIVARARRHGVPTEQEAAQILTKGIAIDDEAEAKLVAEIRRDRQARGNRPITDEDIQAGRQWGRK